MDSLIKRTEAFLRSKLNESDYYKQNKSELNYRIEHSIRVANIGKIIAEKEGLNSEHMVIACLLHDIAYCRELKSEEDWKNHGRESAKLARPYLESLGLDKKVIDEMCFGIAIHVDEKADFEGEHTLFAKTISDADNIDRFDAYRLYESLKSRDIEKLELKDKLELAQRSIKRLTELSEIEFASKTANEMWLYRLEFQLDFFRRLKRQLELSCQVI